MASLAIAAAGAGIGAAIPGVGAAIGWTIGSFIGSTLFAEGQDVQGPRLSDLKVQSSAYGKDIPIVYGKMRIAGNVIWATPIRETANEEEQGKGGSGNTVTTYTYDATFAVGLCEGEIAGVTRIWADAKLIYKATSDTTIAELQASNRAAKGIRFYLGTQTQQPDSLIQADKGVANTQAFRGLAYVVFNRLQLEEFGKRIPNLTFEVVGSAVETGPRKIAGGTFTAGNPTLPSYPVIFSADGILRVGDAADVNKTQLDIFSLDGDYLGNDGANIEDAWPPYSAEGAGTNDNLSPAGYLGGKAVHVRNFNGTTAHGPIGSADTVVLEAYYDSASSSYKWANSLDHLLPDGFYVRTAVCSPDQARLLITGSMSSIGDSTTYYLINDSQEIQESGTITAGAFGSTGSTIGRTSLATNIDVASAAFIEDDYQHIWMTEGTAVNLLKIEDGNISAVASIGGAPGTGTRRRSIFAKDGVAWIVTRNTSTAESAWGVYTRNPYLTDAQVSLSAIQSDICQRAGLEAADINVTALTDSVTGYVIPRNMSARSASEPLQKAYFYDAAEISNKLTFVKRGGASVATITEGELGAHDYGSDYELITHDRAQDAELPSEVVVKFVDENRAYQDGAQRSQRINHTVENVVTLDLPIAMTATQGRQIAEKHMQNTFTERDRYTFSLSRDYLQRNPTNILTVPANGVSRDVRINKITYGPILTIEAVADSPNVYQSSAVAGEGEAVDDTVDLQGPTKLHLLDIPLLRNQDNDEGIYLAASGYLNTWAGAQVYSSNAQESGYTSTTNIFNDATIGTANNVLADASEYDWDRSNTLSVNLINGELSSATEDAVVQGANYFLLGSHANGWEVCQFANATLEADGSYTLDTLTRGRRGTGWATGTHAVGDNFILIGALTLKRQEHAYNSTLYYKAATFGTFLDEAYTQSLQNEGVSLKPFAPYRLSFSLDGSNNLTGSWQHRSRYVAPTFRDLPVFESSESYEIDIIKTGSVLVTKTVSTNSLSYTATQQTSDGLTAGDFDTIKVYQISETVGRGYVAEYTL